MRPLKGTNDTVSCNADFQNHALCHKKMGNVTFCDCLTNYQETVLLLVKAYYMLYGQGSAAFH